MLGGLCGQHVAADRVSYGCELILVHASNPRRAYYAEDQAALDNMSAMSTITRPPPAMTAASAGVRLAESCAGRDADPIDHTLSEAEAPLIRRHGRDR